MQLKVVIVDKSERLEKSNQRMERDVQFMDPLHRPRMGADDDR